MSSRLARTVSLLLGISWILVATPAPLTMASNEPYSEEAVKAAFLYRFSGYVEWPDAKLRGDSFKIAVLGADAVAAKLELLLPGRTIKGRPAEVRRIKSVQELGDAHLLYIGARHGVDLERLIASISDRPVLIVTDHERGLDVGSTVNFLLVDRRVRFEVSLTAAERCGLSVSSELLSVAVRVRGKRLRSETEMAPSRWAALP